MRARHLHNRVRPDRELELVDQRGDIRGIIERAQTEGRYEQLAQIEERLATSRGRLRDTWRRAQAAKLLRQLIHARRSQMVRGALPGLEEKLARLLRQVTGRDRDLWMNEDMTVSGLSDRGTEHEPQALSSGAREQLDLVTRIALGETYAEHYGRTVMVLDDAPPATIRTRTRPAMPRYREVTAVCALLAHRSLGLQNGCPARSCGPSAVSASYAASMISGTGRLEVSRRGGPCPGSPWCLAMASRALGEAELLSTNGG